MTEVKMKTLLVALGYGLAAVGAGTMFVIGALAMTVGKSKFLV